MKKSKLFPLVLAFLILGGGLVLLKNISNSGINANEGIRIEANKEEFQIGESFQLTLKLPEMLSGNSLEENSDEIRSIKISLPEGLIFEEQLTNQLNDAQTNYRVNWDEEKRQIEVLILTQTDLNEVHLLVRGDVEGVYEIEAHRFIEEEVEEISNRLVLSVNAPQPNAAEKESNRYSTITNGIQEGEVTTDKNEIEASSNIVGIQEDTTYIESPSKENVIIRTPRIGNLNMDVDIAPVSKTILAGQTGIYELNLKNTGARSNYKNVKMVVELPKNADFKQDLDEMKIAGIVPIHDTSQGTLTYHFSELVTGQAYKTLISVIPENGTTMDFTQLLASVTLEADGFQKVTETAQITVNASTTLSLTKSYMGVKDTDGSVGSIPGNTVVWKVKASISNPGVGVQFIKPGSLITITDDFESSLSYSGTTSSVVPTQVGTKRTWSFNAPDLSVQQAALNNKTDIWSVEFLVYTNVSASVVAPITINNSVDITSIDYANKTVTKKSNVASMEVFPIKEDVVTSSGSWIFPQYFGPNNGITNPTTNPFPTVTDTASLAYRYQYFVMSSKESVYKEESKTNLYSWDSYDVYTKGYKNVSMHEEIDSNLELQSFSIPKPRAIAKIYEQSSLKTIPSLTLKLEINTVGNWKMITLDTSKYISSDWISVSRSDLNLKDIDHVISYELYYANKDNTPIQGDFSLNAVNALYTIKKGYIGKVTNRLWYSGWVNGATTPFYRFPMEDSESSSIGPRSANVIGVSNMTPVARNIISFHKKTGNQVNIGANRVSAQLHNDSSSMVRMSKNFSGSIILPLGVTINEAPNITFWDGKGGNVGAAGGSYIVKNNYNGTGRQKINVNWNDSELFPGKNLGFDFDVTIDRNAEMPLDLYFYAISGDPKLSVPAVTQPNISSSTLETDIDDINEDGNTVQELVKAGNNFILLRDTNVQTEKTVKGDKDTTYSKFAHTSPGGIIDYRLNVTNTTDENITKFVLMDALPSVGDLALTDGASRGSMFTPSMTGQITIPAEWKDKVTVFYSTSTNPKRDDLVKNVIYPGTTQTLQNPLGATDPIWTLATSITDWSEIHSYKIEVNEGVSVIPGQNIMLEFRMKAPEEKNIADKTLLDPTVHEQTRAAWSSFAYASNTLQAVEPERVGVVMDGLGKVGINKIDSEDTSIPLSGAKFVIAATEADLEAGLYIKKEATGNLVYPNDAGYFENTENYEVISDSKGVVLFDSLRLNESNGKVYFIKEIQAPTGYQLPNKGIQMEASLETVPIMNQIKNIKKVEMPKTGSMRIVIFILLGAGFICTGIIHYTNNKLRKE